MTASAPDPHSLRGRHALVTGASRGIGSAIAECLARLGADLTLVARDPDRLRGRGEQLAAETGRNVTWVAADLSQPADVDRVGAQVGSRSPAVDILVNNAGASASAPFVRTTRTSWNAMLSVNLLSAVDMTRAFLPGMLERGQGRIVNIASLAGLQGYAYVSAYCAAKHALVGFTRSLAKELSGTGVTANAVCPGYTRTPMLESAVRNIAAKTGRSETDARLELARANPGGELVEPEAVARDVAWLCSAAARDINGQALQLPREEG